MKQDLTNVTIILDRSGSMGSIREATVKMFNDFIADQKKLPGDCDVRLVQFDTPNGSTPDIETVFSTPLQQVKPLDINDFNPRGGTPLHDAMGMTIADIREQLNALPEEDRPAKVLVITITDGEENSSTEYNSAKVKSLIGELEPLGWDFVFLGANQDAVLAAQRYGIQAQKAMTYVANAAAVQSVSCSLASYTSAVRSSHSIGDMQNVAFSQQDRIKAQWPDGVDEDDLKANDLIDHK